MSLEARDQESLNLEIGLGKEKAEKEQGKRFSIKRKQKQELFISSDEKAGLAYRPLSEFVVVPFPTLVYASLLRWLLSLPFSYLTSSGSWFKGESLFKVP